MGIPRFTDFINKSFTKWLLVSSQKWEHLIVDGSNACCKLYDGNYTWLLGGEYKPYSLRVKEFFEELKSHFKNPIVVIDGGKFGCGVKKTRDKPRLRNKPFVVMEKMRDLQDRSHWEFREAKGNDLSTPRMLISVFMDVLRSLGIKFYLVESEADNVIAGLASHFNCPVLSSDGDFFIFQLVGYIQLDHWLLEKNNASMFNVHRFMEQFSLVQYEQCLLLPAMLGNDFIEPESSTFTWSVRDLVREVSKFESCEEFLKSRNRETGQKFEEAKKFYFDSPCLPPCFCAEDFASAAPGEKTTGVKINQEATTEKVATMTIERATVTVEAATAASEKATDEKEEASTATGAIACDTKRPDDEATPLPEWVFREFERGCFPTYLIKVHRVGFVRLPKVVEVIKQESAWKISGRIRQYLYGFMGLPSHVKINEIIREDCYPKCHTDSVSPCNFVKRPVTITDPLFTPTNKDELQDLVLTVLNCHKIPEHDMHIFNHLEEKWKLPIAATFYWYRHESTPRDQRRDLLKSLLLSFLTCSNVIQVIPPSLPPVTPITRSRHLTALHAFAQWQCVYYDAMTLNYLARKPFLATSTASLYSGEVAMHYATIVCHERNWLTGFIATGSEEWDLVDKILYLITQRQEEDGSWTLVDSHR